jgi:drug/metabolite transporter (DMT)-like permease
MKPAVAMLVASFGFAVMGVFVKLGAAHFATAEMVFWRSLLGMLATAVMLHRAGLGIRTTKLGTHVHRGVAGFVSLFMFFYALTALPIAMATTLNYTSPLFVALLFTLLARERMRPLLVASVLVGFAGAVLLLRPTIEPTQLVPAFAGLVSGAVAAVAFWNVRQLVQADEPEERVVFYFTLLCTAGALVWMLPQSWHAITLDNVGYLAGVGVSGTVAQLAITRAYGQGSAIASAALSYSGIVFSAILGIAVFDETLPLVAWIGMALIVGAGIMAVKVRQPERSETPPQITND